jgi:hypothetical protein
MWFVGFTTEQHKAEDRLQDIPDFDEPFGSEEPLDDVLHDSARADISHTGQNLDIQQAEEEGDALGAARVPSVFIFLAIPFPTYLAVIIFQRTLYSTPRLSHYLPNARMWCHIPGLER